MKDLWIECSSCTEAKAALYQLKHSLSRSQASAAVSKGSTEGKVEIATLHAPFLMITCSRCKGLGFVLTEDGERLAALIHGWTPPEPVPF